MASRVRLRDPYHEATEAERPPPALTNDMLEEIILRVASPADLARASAACVSFRRLIADKTFLRRYRSIHPPLLLGFVTSYGFIPVVAPHPSAAVARTVARAGDFSFHYLPRPTTKWYPCAVRNGRVLVGCRTEKGNLDLVVCDPLSGRYLVLPPITDDLLASVELLQEKNTLYPMASFIPSRGPSGGIEEDTTFSVILWMRSNTRLGVLIFSSVSGCWSVSMSTNCHVLNLNNIGGLYKGQCAYDCFYWKLYKMNTLIKLDMNTMQFCAFDLPPGHDERPMVIVESGRNRIAMFSLNYEGTSVDYYTLSRNGSENSHEWQMMSTIPLPPDYHILQCFRGPTEGYIFLGGVTIEHDEEHLVFLSLEIKSLKIERVSTTSFNVCGHPYFGFPPSMSPIRIQGYGED